MRHYMILVRPDGYAVNAIHNLQPHPTKEEALRPIRNHFPRLSAEDRERAYAELERDGLTRVPDFTLYLAELPGFD